MQTFGIAKNVNITWSEMGIIESTFNKSENFLLMMACSESGLKS